MHSVARLLGAAAIGIALTVPAAADEAVDRLFDTGQFRQIETGTVLAFTHTRETHDAESVPAFERNIDVAVREKTAQGNTRPVIVSFREGEREIELRPFGDDGGNPMLVFFLESVAKAVAKSTGGSPFYIKNRIIDAFQRGTEISAVELVRDGKTMKVDRIVYSPFALEEKKARLQNFANMEIAFLLSDEVPGHFIELRAVDDPGEEGGFSEYIVLDGKAEAVE